jgi:hypothetical protein
MTESKITINGQHYDSPEAMPPDVRRTYDDAMRAAGSSLASAQTGGSTQVFTGHAGDHIGASLVVNRIVTVNNRRYGSVDQLPSDVRQLYDDAIKGAGPQATHPKTSLHISVNLTGPQVRAPGDSSGSQPPLPIEPSSTESRIRDIPVSLAILTVIALILWSLLGR